MAHGGWDFKVMPVDIDETPLPGEAPRAYVQRLAENKALALGERMGNQIPSQGSPRPEEDELLVAADTTVADLPDGADGAEAGMTILGKPSSPAEAEQMLRRLRNRSHMVFTGLAILRRADNRLFSDLCETRVFMRNYSDAEMQAYIASGDPLDKAGAYAIQHSHFHPVERLEGCFANVVGLPLCALARLLSQAGQPSPHEAVLAQACASEFNYRCPFYPLDPL